MKSIVILFNESNSYSCEKAFGGKSALELTKEVFKDFDWVNESEIFTLENIPTVTDLLSEMCKLIEQYSAENVVFSFADCPFLNKKLISRLMESHTKYRAEYSFADGYSYGFAPEILYSGTVKILKELSLNNSLGKTKVTREGLFELIKTDINSFEIETILAETDWRMNRFAFHCGKKENFLACKELYKNYDCTEVEELEKIAASSVGILKTVPGFYNLQICDGINVDSIYSPYVNAFENKNKLQPFNVKTNMRLENFEKLIDKIAAFSSEAVVGFSAWGEPLLHPDFVKMVEKVLSYKGLSVYVETDGLGITEDLCKKLEAVVSKAEERTNGWEKLMVGITLDASTKEKYLEIHHKDCFDSVLKSVEMLAKVFPGNVYPMFIRMNQNEDELESFFRFWNEKTSPSSGQFIIQKYDDYAGVLPPSKPADLSPIDRNVCWHLRRDFTILSNGDVPLCYSCIFDEILGNAITDDLETIWNKSDDLIKAHLSQKYDLRCGKCDEFYTYNF